MGKMNKFAAQLKVGLIAFSLLPLQAMAECYNYGPGFGLDQTTIGQLNTDISNITVRMSSPEEVIAQCITNDFEKALTTDNNLRDVVLVPKDYAAACQCLAYSLPKRSDEEIAGTNQRMKELKVRHQRLNIYLSSVKELRKSLNSYFLLNPTGELPQQCNDIVGEPKDFPGSTSCRNDLSKVVNTLTKLEPAMLSQGKDMREGAWVKSRAFSDMKEEIIFMNKLQEDKLAERMGPPTPRDEADRLIHFLFDGIPDAGIEYTRERSRTRIAENGTLLNSVGFAQTEGVTVPFSRHEVDQKALELIKGMVAESDKIINQGVAGSPIETGLKDLAMLESDKDRIRGIVETYESKNEDFGIPRDPVLPPLAEERVFEPQNDFDKAVLERYRLMAKVINGTRSYVDFLDQIFELEADKASLRVKPDLDEVLMSVATKGFEETASGADLAADCEIAVTQRKFVCEDIEEEGFDSVPLSARDISLYGAVDLKRGQEAEYGQIACAPFLQSTPGGLGYYVSDPKKLWDDYMGSQCDYSQPTQSASMLHKITFGFLGTSSTCEPAVQPAATMAIAGEILMANNISQARASANLRTDFDRMSSPAVADKQVTTTSGGYSAVVNDRGTVRLSDAKPGIFSPKDAQESEARLYGQEITQDQDNNGADRFVTPTRVVSVKSNMPSLYDSIASSSSPSTLGEGVSTTYTGSVDADAVSETSFSPSSLFGTTVADSSRYYDPSYSLPQDIKPVENQPLPQMSEGEYAATQRALASSNPEYDSLVKMYEELQAQLEDLKGEKASKENDELIAELKTQVADLKKSREELEDRIESEKRERTRRANDKDVPAARPTQSYARSDSSFRPAAQPTYSGGSNLPVGGTQGFISPTPGVVTSTAAIAPVASTKRETSARANADLASANVNAGSGARSAAVAVGALRLTSQAFDKLSSTDLKSLYESNNGEPIFVEKTVADGNGSQKVVVEKYVPELIEGEVVYINSGVSDKEVVAEAETEAEAEVTESTDPGRAIASVAEPEVAPDTMRQVKELEEYKSTLYSPIHQELISKIQAAIAEQRK